MWATKQSTQLVDGSLSMWRTAPVQSQHERAGAPVSLPELPAGASAQTAAPLLAHWTDVGGQHHELLPKDQAAEQVTDGGDGHVMEEVAPISGLEDAGEDQDDTVDLDGVAEGGATHSPELNSRPLLGQGTRPERPRAAKSRAKLRKLIQRILAAVWRIVARMEGWLEKHVFGKYPTLRLLWIGAKAVLHHLGLAILEQLAVQVAKAAYDVMRSAYAGVKQALKHGKSAVRHKLAHVADKVRDLFSKLS